MKIQPSINTTDSLPRLQRPSNSHLNHNKSHPHAYAATVSLTQSPSSSHTVLRDERPSHHVKSLRKTGRDLFLPINNVYM